MALPIVPIVVASAAAALYFLMRGQGGQGTQDEPPLPPPPPPSPNKFVRPKRPPNPPAGAGFATVSPACGPGDDPACRNGLLVHSIPSTSVASRVTKPDSSPTSLHAVTGDEVAVIQASVPDQSSPATSRLWAEIMTPMGNVGFVSSVDPQGRSNLTNVTPADDVRPVPVVPVATAGVGGGYGWREKGPRVQYSRSNAIQTPRYVRCTAPSGCLLQTANPQHQTVVENGAMVQLLHQVPGAAYVRYHERHHNAFLDGWMSSAWLTG